jgi:ubiquinone/menaquinone biosynthesis C-methylase UbiE
VIEVGAGNGLNFAHYPRTVTEVVAVEPESFLRSRAEEAAGSVPIPLTILDGTADALPVPDAVFDAGLASLVLCSVPDQPSALAELRRVIRAGGELRFFEHVVSRRAGPARVQRIADRTIRPFLSGGCHAGRDTLAAIDAAGFVIEHSDRFSFRPNPIDVTSPHIVGIARRL